MVLTYRILQPLTTVSCHLDGLGKWASELLVPLLFINEDLGPSRLDGNHVRRRRYFQWWRLGLRYHRPSNRLQLSANAGELSTWPAGRPRCEPALSKEQTNCPIGSAFGNAATIDQSPNTTFAPIRELHATM